MAVCRDQRTFSFNEDGNDVVCRLLCKDGVGLLLPMVILFFINMLAVAETSIALVFAGRVVRLVSGIVVTVAVGVEFLILMVLLMLLLVVLQVLSLLALLLLLSLVVG